MQLSVSNRTDLQQWERPTVLVVDDQAEVRSVLSRLLREDGMDVVEASDGTEALQACAAAAPDLVLLDAVMPGGCDGYEVCRRLKVDPRTALIPVVIVTGFSSAEDRVRGAEVGADGYFAKPVVPAELRGRVRSALRVKQLTDELEAAETVLFALAQAVEEKDSATEGHCARLSALAERLGARLGLPETELVALRRAGMVHDIGKVAVPDAILLKRAPLSEEEWCVMRQHPAAGERICSPLRSFRRVLPIVRHHHERFDGSGYPDGLAGEAIPITARVLQVVDVYDALTMERPYKRALAPAEALATLESEVQRGWWDPRVFSAFRAMLVEN
jgi:putative two-component system response regulator